MRGLLAVAAVLWRAAAVAGEPLETDLLLAGHWEGAIATVTGELIVRVDLERAADGWRGSLDIPQQGAEGLALAGIEVEPGRIRFALAGVPGEPSFEGALLGGEIRGTFTQAGSRLPFRLGREAVAGPPRPQEPRPPFPYRSEEVRLASGEVELAGTLSLPDGPGPFPAIVLLSGSGAQDRDGEILGHRPLRLLADGLVRRGMAVLRCDDRGVGGSSGNLAASTTESLAGDALAAIDFLAGRPELIAERIGLLGHSEGGLVAALAASRRPTVAFVVLLATPGVPGRELLPLQARRLAVAGGAAPGVVARQVELLVEGLELLSRESDPERLRRGLDAVARRQLELFGGGAGSSAETLEAALAREIDQLVSPWFRYFVAYDPRPALSQLRMPVLVVAGELDLQVPPEQNVPALEAALAAAGNTEVTVRRIAGLNHLLQPATTGLPAEYYLLETTLDPAVLALVEDWVVERARGVAAP